MRIVCLICLLAAGAQAAEPSAFLVSERAALVAPETPAAVVEYLAGSLNALVCIPGGSMHPEAAGPLKIAPLALPPLPADHKAALDSVRRWRERFGISIALPAAANDRLARSAAEAGLAVFEPVSRFAEGAVAIPVESGYKIYISARDQFYPAAEERLARWRQPASDDGPAPSAGQAMLAELGAEVETLTSGTPPVDLFRRLALIIGVSDSLSESGDPVAPLAGQYARRWGHVLGTSLAPRLETAQLTLLAGIEQPRTLVVTSQAPRPIDVRGIRIPHAALPVRWHTEFPRTLAAGGRLQAVGHFRAASEGQKTTSMLLDCRYAGFDFSAPARLDLDVRSPLAAHLEPPIVFATDAIRRTDPDYLVATLTSALVLRNRSEQPLHCDLAWRAEEPLSVSGGAPEVTLAPGESRRLAYTLSFPQELKYKNYDFRAVIALKEGDSATAAGQLWKEAPAKDGDPLVGLLDAGPEWLEALGALGVAACPVAITQLASADLSVFRALIVPAQSDPPPADVKAILESYVARGGLILLDLDPAAERWLPWPTNLVRLPGPQSAKFYNRELSWWRAPNRLVGGCFAAADKAAVQTLPAGAPGWEPLLVDDAGKGFMYRRAVGNGWYVVVHSGWTRRLEQLNRRALLGLLNLVGGRRS